MSRATTVTTTTTVPTAVIPNTHLNLSLLEVAVVGEGDRRNIQETEHLILGFAILNNVTIPLTLSLPDPQAHYLVFDSKAKRYYSARGVAFADYAAATRTLWLESDAAEARRVATAKQSEPTPEPIREAPALTTPSIGAPDDAWGTGQRPRPTSGPRAATPVHPRERDTF